MDHARSTPSRWVLAPAVLALVIGACGGDDGAGSLPLSVSLSSVPEGGDIDRFELRGRYLDGDGGEAFETTVAAEGGTARVDVRVERDRLLRISATGRSAGAATHRGSLELRTGRPSSASLVLRPFVEECPTDAGAIIVRPEDGAVVPHGAVGIEVAIRCAQVISLRLEAAGEVRTRTGFFDVGTTVSEFLDLDPGPVDVRMVSELTAGGTTSSEISLDVVAEGDRVRRISPCTDLRILGSIPLRAGDRLRIRGNTVDPSTAFDLAGVVFCDPELDVFDAFPPFGPIRNFFAPEAIRGSVIVDGGATCGFPFQGLACPDGTVDVHLDTGCTVWAEASSATSGLGGTPASPFCVTRGTCPESSPPFDQNCANPDAGEFTMQVLVNGTVVLE